VAGAKVSGAAKKLDALDLTAALRRQLERHPYVTVALAAGVGFLLGTGLGGPLVALLTSRSGVALTSSLLAPLLEQSPARQS
jgi:hypothetical protein